MTCLKCGRADIRISRQSRAIDHFYRMFGSMRAAAALPLPASRRQRRDIRATRTPVERRTAELALETPAEEAPAATVSTCRDISLGLHYFSLVSALPHRRTVVQRCFKLNMFN